MTDDELAAALKIVEALARALHECQRGIDPREPYWDDLDEEDVRRYRQGAGSLRRAMLAAGFEIVETAEIMDGREIWKEAMGSGHQFKHFGNHEAAHPKIVAAVMHEVCGSRAADVIAALVFQMAIARNRAESFAQRLRDGDENS